jgi:hypothetical protein
MNTEWTTTMMKLEYAGGEVLMSDAASRVILRYAESLAMHNSSDTVTVPVMTVEGVAGVAEILIGPASQLLAIPTAENHVLDDAAAIGEMQAKLDALLPGRAVASEPEPSSQVADDMDLGWP